MSVESIYNSVLTGLSIPLKMKMTAMTMLHVPYNSAKKPSNPVMTNMSIKSSKTSAKKYHSTNKSWVMLCYRIDFGGFAIKNRLLSGLFFVLPLREPRERGYPSNIIYYTVRGGVGDWITGFYCENDDCIYAAGLIQN
jgi:hypothetical protein